MLAMGFPLSWMVLAAGSVPAWLWLLPLGVLLLVYPLNALARCPGLPAPAGALDGLAEQIALPEEARCWMRAVVWGMGSRPCAVRGHRPVVMGWSGAGRSLAVRAALPLGHGTPRGFVAERLVTV